MEFEKDFKNWATEKEKIHFSENDTDAYFHEGDIWWCKLGVNIGNEQDGKGMKFSRPVLIIKKFNQFLFWAVPLSTILKHNPYYALCQNLDQRIRSAMISQLRLISVKRLTDKITSAEKDSFMNIKKAIKNLL